MLLYRAINDNDKNNLDNNKDIYCSLVNSFLSLKRLRTSAKTPSEKIKVKKRSAKVVDYVNTCILGYKGNALDIILGHVGGQNIKAETSPWISVSSDFYFVAEEYSVPQAGKYNYFRKRKPIIMIEIPDDILLKKVDEVKEKRNDRSIKDFCVDLREGNLNTLFNDEAVLAQKYNPNLLGYSPTASIDRENGKKTRVDGFSNYAYDAGEIVMFARIKKDYVKAVLSPELIDILYSCNVNIEENKDFIINNCDSLNKFLISLNEYFIGKNLIDFLKDNYSNIKGNNVEEKYDHLKQVKLQIMAKIVDHINKEYNTDFEATRVLDEEVLVRCYQNIGNLSDKAKNDLILIEKDNHIYVHSFKKKGYYNEQLDKVIPTEKVKKKVK